MKKYKFYPFCREFNITVHFVEIISLILSCIIIIDVDIVRKIIFVVAIFVLITGLELFNYAVNKNMSSFYIAFFKNRIVKGYGLMLFKNFEREEYDKITLAEYINYPMRCPKRRYNSWREIQVNVNEDVGQIIYQSVFIIYKEYLLENFPLDSNSRPYISQDCFNSFVDKVMNKNIILLDATYENYAFLRKFYKAEHFNSTIGKKQELLYYEQEFNEADKRKKD